MKNTKYYLFSIVIFFLLFSCIKNDYEKTLCDYLDYLKSGNLKVAYNLLSQNDRQSIDIEDFIRDEEASALGRLIKSKIKYKIIDSRLSLTGLSVNIKTEINQIDILYLYNLIPELSKNNLKEKEVKKIFFDNERMINNSYIKKIVTYQLVKENNNWRIKADFGRQKKQKELMNLASKYYDEKNYIEALNYYKEALSFNNYNDEALKGVLKVKEKINYIDKYISIDYKKLKKENNKIFFEVKIKNNGTIIVKKILLSFLFINNNNIVGRLKADFSKDGEMIGYQSESTKIVAIDDMKVKYDNIECQITGIDFN
jgi:tetratricopeptide (TPR) repeat protein